MVANPTAELLLPPFYLPLSYMAGLLIWLLLMAAAFYGALSYRRALKRRGQRLFVPHLLLSLWLAFAVCTLAELWCALVVDQSDAFNMTNISKRWFRKYIEAQRNEAGWRDRREFTRTLPDGQRRIVILGDSFTVGHGIRRCEDRFSDRVEVAFEREKPGQFVVANLADPGMETSQIQARLKATLELGYQVDIAVYVFMLNDIEGYDPRTQQMIQEMQRAEPRFFLLSQTYFLNWAYFRALQASSRGGDYFTHLSESYQQAPWDGLRRKLDEMHADCKAHGVDFRMVLFPFLQNLGDDYPYLAAHRKLREYCRKSKIPVLDLEPVLARHVAEGLTVNRFDAHPNERAHELAAEAITHTLLADLLANDQAPSTTVTGSQ